MKAMTQSRHDLNLSWGNYDAMWLLQEYLKELTSLSDPSSNFARYVGQTKGVLLTSRKTADAPEEKVGGANIQIFHDYALIDVIWIRPEYRSQGLGRMLVNEVERHAIEIGLRRLLLSAFEHQNSIEFWKRLGCEEVGRVRDYPAGKQLVYLHKRLA